MHPGCMPRFKSCPSIFDLTEQAGGEGLRSLTLLSPSFCGLLWWQSQHMKQVKVSFNSDLSASRRCLWAVHQDVSAF